MVMNLYSLQNQINRLITSYLSGNHLNRPSLLFYPVLKIEASSKKKGNFTLKKKIADMLNIDSSVSSNRFISQSIKRFNSEIKNHPNGQKTETVDVARVYDPENYSGPRMSVINEFCDYIKNKLSPFLIDAFLHGSLSTLDYTGYSDLDTLFLIRNDVAEDPSSLRELSHLFIKSKKYLYRFDPCQHHGHFFLVESELEFYNQSFLPLSVIKLSTSILGRKKTIHFKIRDSREEARSRFLASKGLVKKYMENPEKLNNLYYLKLLLSHFMMLPVLFLQLHGEYISKKDSFDVLRKRIPQNIWAVVDRVSEIRTNWSQNLPAFKGFIYKKINAINPLLSPLLAKYYFKRIPGHHNGYPSIGLNDMNRFLEYLLKESGLKL
jgi:hypothetical protein